MKTLIALVLGLASACACAAEPETWRFYGYAYDLKTNRYLYTEVHEQRVDVEADHWISGSIDYYLPDGKLFGRKTLDFSKDWTLPVYRMEQYDIGRVEAVTDNGDPIKMLIKARGDKPEKTGSVPKKPMMTADSGFHMFIREHFEELMRGDTVKFAFAAAPELDQFKFKMYRIDDTTFEGKPAVRIKVEPSSLLSFIVDPMELTYDPGSRRLCEFRGISNIREANGKAVIARIAYYLTTPDDAPKPLPPLGGPEKR